MSHKVTRIFCYLMILALVGLGSFVMAERKAEIRLTNVEAVSNLSNDTVKFLFKTNKGAHIRLFLGKSIKSMELIMDVGGYDDSDGLVLDELTPGKRYYYRIVSEYKREIASSKIFSFVTANQK